MPATLHTLIEQFIQQVDEFFASWIAWNKTARRYSRGDGSKILAMQDHTTEMVAEIRRIAPALADKLKKDGEDPDVISDVVFWITEEVTPHRTEALKHWPKTLMKLRRIASGKTKRAPSTKQQQRAKNIEEAKIRRARGESLYEIGQAMKPRVSEGTVSRWLNPKPKS